MGGRIGNDGISPRHTANFNHRGTFVPPRFVLAEWPRSLQRLQMFAPLNSVVSSSIQSFFVRSFGDTISSTIQRFSGKIICGSTTKRPGDFCMYVRVFFLLISAVRFAKFCRCFSLFFLNDALGGEGIENDRLQHMHVSSPMN